MARMSAITTKRRACLFLVLLTAFILWCRNHPTTNPPPEWNVVDFHIKDRVADSTYGDTSSADRSSEIAPPQQQQLSYDELQDKVQHFIQWDRPSTDHWPAWHDYDQSTYDPNRWEAMERQYGYFLNNTIQELESAGITPEPYLPYPKYNNDAWKEKWLGGYVPCQGPRGGILGSKDSRGSVVQGYCAPDTFVRETVGSARVLGLDMTTCFDQSSRYSAYGLHREDQSELVDWDKVRWGSLQERCFQQNSGRYHPEARGRTETHPIKTMRQSSDPLREDHRKKHSVRSRRYKTRTAILIRSWEGYDYKENDLQAIRALITETSLLSGGEYQVFLLVNIKQREANIYDDQVYKDLLERTVPEELQDIAILWTERVLEKWYPYVGDWQVYWMQFMPLQWFSKQHPEFDYVWNWETDARYIGNHYHFLEQVTHFAKNAPRKHLWERNSRFFFPNTWNDDYDAFLADTNEQIINASALGLIDEPVWGPRTYAPYQHPLGPSPPTPAEEDDFEWGVGEEADLITLQPIWDPTETGWSYKNHIWNFIPGIRPQFTPENGNADGFDHPDFSTIPRRVFINTVARFSREILHVMHLENLQGRAMQAEMWPATVALHHGLKAVYAPHPIWSDRKWPAWYAEATFNADDGIPARWGQQADSPYNHDREANFGGWSWYYRSVFPHVLYRRWMGWKAHDWGWDADQAKQRETEKKMALIKKLGINPDQLDKFRMCLPGMLLHPVKNVYEGADGG